MKFAYVTGLTGADTDLLLTNLSTQMLGQGYKVVGLVQANNERLDGCRCDMDVHVLPDGPDLRISQDLGPGARGCRLDSAVLEEAVHAVSVGLEAGADLLIINKFGKQEADGRGFRDLIGEALSLEIPVIIGVNSLNIEAFLAYSCGSAQKLAPEMNAISDWVVGMQVSAA